MPQRSPDALTALDKLLRVLVVLNLVFGLLILALLVASLIAEDMVMNALGVQAGPGRERLILGGRAVMVLGLVGIPLGHNVLTRLQAIVATVALGDPFVSNNATHLQAIAWTVFGLELLHLAVGAVAYLASSSSQSLDLGWNLSVTRWLALLFCFVLAQVFARGTRMREELEGTV